MKTKQIPAVIMLSAGFLTCMVAIYQKMEFLPFAKLLLLVMIGFYALGSIIAYVLDKNFKEPEEDNAEPEEEVKTQEEEKELENVESEEEKQ